MKMLQTVFVFCLTASLINGDDHDHLDISLSTYVQKINASAQADCVVKRIPDLAPIQIYHKEIYHKEIYHKVPASNATVISINDLIDSNPNDVIEADAEADNELDMEIEDCIKSAPLEHDYSADHIRAVVDECLQPDEDEYDEDERIEFDGEVPDFFDPDEDEESEFLTDCFLKNLTELKYARAKIQDCVEVYLEEDMSIYSLVTCINGNKSKYNAFEIQIVADKCVEKFEKYFDEEIHHQTPSVNDSELDKYKTPSDDDSQLGEFLYNLVFGREEEETPSDDDSELEKYLDNLVFGVFGGADEDEENLSSADNLTSCFLKELPELRYAEAEIQKCVDKFNRGNQKPETQTQEDPDEETEPEYEYVSVTDVVYCINFNKSKYNVADIQKAGNKCFAKLGLKR